VAWSGDANNTCTSWIHAAVRMGFTLRVAAPPELTVRPALREWVRKNGGDVTVGEDAEKAVAGADCVVSDAWVSMGDEDSTKRHNLLKAYQVNGRLMARAAKDAVFMHCLPAHRGEEVTDDVIDGPQSAVWDEAENRLHAQKAILVWCLGKI
jgi:ornithine carbamoyltransferase